MSSPSSVAARRRGPWLPRVLAFVGMAGLVLVLAFLAGQGGPSLDRRMGFETISVTAYPIEHFQRGDTQTRQFGKLEFLGGLELRSADPHFGGLSAIHIDRDGERFLGLTDTGDWLRGRIRSRTNGAPVSLSDVSLGPLLLADGRRAKDVGLWDSESLAVVGDSAFVGIERDHSLMRFPLDMDGRPGRGTQVPLPASAKRWPGNRGIEGLAPLRVPASVANRLIGFSERSTEGGNTPTAGFSIALDGGDPAPAMLLRSDAFDLTALDTAPDGSLFVLERRFSPRRGVAMRLRRIDAASLAASAVLDGEVLLEADDRFQIDNMEGLALSSDPDGALIITLVSDNNFSIAQRTLLLRFRLSKP